MACDNSLLQCKQLNTYSLQLLLTIYQKDTQTLNTVRRQRSHIAQVNRSDMRLCNLPGTRAYYNGFSFIRVEGKSVQTEPVVQSTEAVSQHLLASASAKYSVVSSAYCMKLTLKDWMTCAAGDMYRVMRSGPSTEPCGTPYLQVRRDDCCSSTLTDCVLQTK